VRIEEQRLPAGQQHAGARMVTMVYAMCSASTPPPTLVKLHPKCAAAAASAVWMLSMCGGTHQAKLSASCVPHSVAALPPLPACAHQQSSSGMQAASGLQDALTL
jgi:hypothetical protein